MIFSKQQLAIRTIVIATFLSLIFLIIDTQKPSLTAGVRQHIHAAMSPIYGVAEQFRYGKQQASLVVVSKKQLERENKALKAKLAQANVYLQKYAELSSENAHLRGMLSYPTPVDGRVEITSVIGIDNNPLRQILVLNRGTKHGVYVGQTVIDEAGVMGQVINAYGSTSRAMLLSDGDHSIAVKVARTGVRAVVTGNGDNSSLDLNYVPNTADLQVGDKIVSSGLGQRFPKGYMIGIVSYIDRANKHEFIKAKIKPSANLSASNYVMLLFPNEKIQLDIPAPVFEEATQQKENNQKTAKNQSKNTNKDSLKADTQADHVSNTAIAKKKAATLASQKAANTTQSTDPNAVTSISSSQPNNGAQ